MIGGDEESFIRNHWRKRILFTQSAISREIFDYPYDEFLNDYKQVKPLNETLVVSIDDQGTRRMVRPSDELTAQHMLDGGASLVLQAFHLLDSLPNMPETWRVFRRLHSDLCSYLLPQFPRETHPDAAVAAVDIFCAGENTSTGGHYDTGDVFYFVLDGEKEWTLEFEPDPETVLNLFRVNGRYMQDHLPQREHKTIKIRPGDCLYVPPFTYHRVRSQGRSLAVSIGLPAYTEATLLKQVLERLQLERLIWEPLPSYPDRFAQLFQEAEDDTRSRVLALLDAIKRKITATAGTHAPVS